MAREQPHVGDLLPLLESSDIRQVEEIKGLIREHLSTERGAVLVNSLVDYYLETDSQEAMQILSSVMEPHDKHLLDKMNECLATKASRLHTLTLLGHVVRKEPSWIHKIGRFPLLVSLLKCLKTDTDVVVLITGVLVLIILLPMIPQSGKQHLYDFFDIFGRLAAWNLKNPGRVAEVYLIHLHASVYSLFHRLYGMYPCNFVSYLRSHYSMKENVDTFEEVVKPMLEHVRIHPELVTGTKDHELEPTRWKRYEIHDIVIECAKVSLDPREASCEEGYSAVPDPFNAHPQSRAVEGVASPYTDFQSSCGSLSSTQFSTPRQPVAPPSGMQPTYQSPQVSRQVPQAQNEPYELDGLCKLKDPIWSPSSVCGMTTPPPSRSMSPTSVIEASHSAPHSSTGRVHGSLAAGAKGTSSFSPSTATFPSLALSDAIAQPARPSGASSPMHKDERTLDSVRCSLVRREPMREQERSRGDVIEGRGAIGVEVPLTLTALSSFVKEQGLEQMADKELEEDAITEELLKITEDTPDCSAMSGLDSPFCHTTEMLTGSQEPPAPLSGPSWGSRPEALSTPDGRTVLELQQAWAPRAVFSPIEHPPRGEEEREGGAAPTKGGLFSPSPHAEASLSYEPLFDLALPKAAPLFVSRRTPSAQSQVIREWGGLDEESPAAFTPAGLPGPASPLEVLDRLIQQGCDAHDKVLKRLPLPSKSADWTHFGAGSAPLDELHTLRGQLLLLHNQLLYERYKREQHAVRNRRLLRRVINATALEEQNSAMKDQLNLQNMDMLSLKESLQVEQRRYQKLWEERENMVTRLHSQIRQLQQGRDEYYTKNQELQSKLLEYQKKTSELEAELQKANNKVCNTGHQLNQLSIKLTTSENIQQQMAFLNKQMLLLGEVNKLCMEELQHTSADNSKELEMVRSSSDRELERLRQSLVMQVQRLEAAQQRIAELEVQLTKKEHLMAEQKKFLEDVKGQTRSEIQASESRYQAQRQVTQALQSELIQLYSRLEVEGPIAGIGPLPAGGATQFCGSVESRLDRSSPSLEGPKVKTVPWGTVNRSPPATPARRGTTSTLQAWQAPSSVNGSQEHASAPPQPSLSRDGTAPLATGSCPSSGSLLGMRAQELLQHKRQGQWDADARRSGTLAQGLKTELCVEPPGSAGNAPVWTAPTRPDAHLRATSQDGPPPGPVPRLESGRQRQRELRIMDYDEAQQEHS